MNNELFDRMMKDSLNRVNVTPSQGLKKSLGKKLFFQNLLTFHKFKVVIAALFLATTGVLSYGYYSTGVSNNKLMDLQVKNDVTERQRDFDDKLVKLMLVDNNANVEMNSKFNEVGSSSINSPKKNSTFTKTNSINSNSIAANTAKGDERFSSTETDFTKEKTVIVKQDDDAKNSVVKNINANHSIEEIVTHKDLIISERIDFVNPKGFDLGTDYLSNPVSVQEKNYNFKTKRIIRKEFSVDIYKGLMATNDIDNSLRSSEHQEFNWDFYKENESLKTSSIGGIDLNYAVGTKTFKGKVSLGFNASSVVEEKATYQFDEIVDPLWLEFFNVDDFSWVNTYGEDTCTQCFYASNTSEFSEEMKKKENVYKYVSIPLKLGAEVNLKYVTLDIMGGVQLNHLTSATGLYIKMNDLPKDSRLYYWEDMQLTTLDKNNDMLKRNYMSWTTSANLRVRITRQFDLLAGYDAVFSKGNITKSSSVVTKSLKYSQAKLGITFYPNRLPLLKK